MNDDLLGNLLGSLESDELERVSGLLDAEPRFRTRLDLLRRGLAPLEPDRGHLDVPDGFAQRTCQVIRIHIETTRILLLED